MSLSRKVLLIGIIILLGLTVGITSVSVAGQVIGEEPAGSSPTIQDFNSPATGTMYTEILHVGSVVGPALFQGGPIDNGNFLRLAYGQQTPTHNGVAFHRTHVGSAATVVIDLNYRVAPDMDRADGLGIAFLNTSAHNNTGVATLIDLAEEPSFVDSIGVGIDIYESPGDINNNHVSIHYPGIDTIQYDAGPTGLDLGSGEWVHARIILEGDATNSTVTVSLSQCDGPSYTFPPTLLAVPAYEGRLYVGARSGNSSADSDIDNVRVHYLDANESLVAFDGLCHSVLEDDTIKAVTVSRIGSLSNTLEIDYTTYPLSATSPVDFSATAGTLVMNANETSATINIPINSDDMLEAHELFGIELSAVSSGSGYVGGPSQTVILIEDDERARVEGLWGPLFSTEVVAVHAHLLPDGTVLFWNGDEGGGEELSSEALLSGGSTFANPRIWDPVTNSITSIGSPHNLFCSGHAFLSDGRLFAAGGHISLNEGLADAAIYNPLTKRWDSTVPDMNDGRWYPSVLTLGDGNILVVSGTISNAPYTVNNVSQVYDVLSNSWITLTDATLPDPFGDWFLYPWTFLTPAGTVFNAGPDRTSFFLDPAGTGDIEVGPVSGDFRGDGTAVMYDAGQVIIIGGSQDANIPWSTAQTIDLFDISPVFTPTGSMAFQRKYHTGVSLADGTVLVTGGTATGGFNGGDAPIFAAEIWDPLTGLWTTLASMDVQRIYHSTALLLPDGSVFVAGGGEPSPTSYISNRNGQIFMPPYLFAGERPTITAAPTFINWGAQFKVETPDVDSIADVTLVRLGSVTHAFNQSQAFNHLAFDAESDHLVVTMPASSNIVPPGYYMLFIISDEGVPSMAQIVSVPERDFYAPSIQTDN